MAIAKLGPFHHATNTPRAPPATGRIEDHQIDLVRRHFLEIEKPATDARVQQRNAEDARFAPVQACSGLPRQYTQATSEAFEQLPRLAIASIGKAMDATQIRPALSDMAVPPNRGDDMRWGFGPL